MIQTLIFPFYLSAHRDKDILHVPREKFIANARLECLPRVLPKYFRMLCNLTTICFLLRTNILITFCWTLTHIGLE